jgi:hypothetical protein
MTNPGRKSDVDGIKLAKLTEKPPKLGFDDTNYIHQSQPLHQYMILGILRAKLIENDEKAVDSVLFCSISVDFMSLGFAAPGE